MGEFATLLAVVLAGLIAYRKADGSMAVAMSTSLETAWHRQ